MKKIVIAVALVVTLALPSCARFQAAYEVATSAELSPKSVYIMASIFDSVEVTATRYLRLPKCAANTTYICRNPTAVNQIIAAVRSGRVARNNLKAFLKSHPGQLGAQGDYDALELAVNTLQQIFVQYNIKG